MAEEDEREFVYRIDDQDRINYVNQDWLDFAQQNQAPELIREKVLGEKLERFIADWETRHLYEIIYRRIREAGQSFDLPFRCDSAGQRRFFSLHIRARGGSGELEFRSRIERIEKRAPVQLLRYHDGGNKAFAVICSWCKRLRTGKDTWEEIEEATSISHLFGDDPPDLSHGICPECFARVRRELNGS